MVLVLGTMLLTNVLNKPWPSFLWPTLLLTLSVTFVIFKRVYESGRDRFVLLFLGTLVLKLLIFLGYIVAVILLDRSGATANVVFFLACYLVFSFVEILILYPRVSR